MSKLGAIWSLFRQGQAVSDPAAWKKRQITATVLGGLLMTLVNVASAFGYPLPVDTDTANAIAAGIIGIINVVLTMTTTEKIGLPPVEQPKETPKEEVKDETPKVPEQIKPDADNPELYSRG